MLQSVKQLDVKLQWKFLIHRPNLVAYDPDTGVYLTERRSGTGYVLVFGKPSQQQWKSNFRAWSDEEAIQIAEQRLSKIPSELITVEKAK